MSDDFSALDDLPILELFRMEVETQSAILTREVLALENNAGGIHRFERLMRASHSLKGAARIIGRTSAVRIAHTMEHYFATAQENAILPRKETIAILRRGIDLLTWISRVPDDSIAGWEEEHEAEIAALSASLAFQNETDRPG